MPLIHNLGFPRLGTRRELKRALEAYWRGESDLEALQRAGRELRRTHWRRQRDLGLDIVPVGDFAWYDHVLETSAMLGVVPERFGDTGAPSHPDTLFRMARGDRHTAPCAMTKWFDTNYHYLVPEVTPDQAFRPDPSALAGQLAEARADSVPGRPVLLGPLTWLWLAQPAGRDFDRLQLVPSLADAYCELLAGLAGAGAEWAQIDEPILCLDLPEPWQRAFGEVYGRLGDCGPRRLLVTYFGGLEDNLPLAFRLPVDAVHLDAVRADDEAQAALEQLTPQQSLSLGVVDGRNVWRTDLERQLTALAPLHDRLGDRLWLAPSCSLLHVPVDVELEQDLDPELKSWLAFAVQKLEELETLRGALRHGRASVAEALAAQRRTLESRRSSPRTRNAQVRAATAAVGPDMRQRRSPWSQRYPRQQARLQLPELPTTTIGSFPQTREIRRARRDYRAGRLDAAAYQARMRGEIAAAVETQEAIGLDLLVHGEPERNDMVEYFGEQLSGYAFTRHGWVQSYGSRGVKPPILFGDVDRPGPITVEWTRYAQSLTRRPMKGMLTGPVTLLQWSFPRDDLPRAEIAQQLALALRAEVADLERAGTGVIQIDEPALREGMPLRRHGHADYLRWAVDAFRLATAGVADTTQIHSHMCYSDFNDIIDAIAGLDADVITIEAARSRMRLLDAFRDFAYPNAIGPGVYDIHAPRVPPADEIAELLGQALQRLPREQLWVNPDCGLKTRGWEEIRPALSNMVEAARRLRQDTGSPA